MATCGAQWTPESERKATLRDVVQRLEHVFIHLKTFYHNIIVEFRTLGRE